MAMASAKSNKPGAMGALDHKNAGNDHFVKRRFGPALECYTEALSVVCDEDPLRAVLLSNRSSCYYEIGNYGEIHYAFTLSTGISWHNFMYLTVPCTCAP